VRQFIRQEFPRHERVKYISPILRFFERLVDQFAPAKGTNASVTHTRYAAARVELCIHAGSGETAARALLDIHAALIEHGHSEEFVRLAAPLLEDPELDTALYDKLLGSAVTILSDLGDFRDADSYLDRFEVLIPGKTARYVRLCNLRCYSLWSRREFGRAIEWGSRGHELKSSAGLDTENDCRHHLALAWRDAGNIQPALEYFRNGIPLNEILAGRVPDHLRENGPFWGNVGRCLQLEGALSDARFCLIRSALALRVSGSSEVFVNRGWAARWLGEVADAQGDAQSAYICYSAAQHYWLRSSPPRSNEMRDRVAQLHGVPDSVPQWRLEREYHDLLSSLA
jgi:tetratricopeptide (TPR) repeat protein